MKNRGNSKIPVKTSSLAAAGLCWLLFSVLAFFIAGVLRDRAALIRDNENERIFFALFANLRNNDSLTEALESNALLRERLKGFAVYAADFSCRYRWGDAPELFDQSLLDRAETNNRSGRFTIPDSKGRSVKFVLYMERMVPRPPPPGEMQGRERSPPDRRPQPPRNNFPLGLDGANYIYIDISHKAYWRTITLTSIFLPVSCIALLALILFIRRLYLHNIEYRERIEAQKNLVVLGTAAGALAHEIKNPLLSIRLQTGILEKTLPGEALGEIAIINEEVDRVSSLVRRISDYLREGPGNAAPLDAYPLLEETGERLCGRNIIVPGACKEIQVFADSERLRSVFENLIRNALESGGPPEDVVVTVEIDNASVVPGNGVIIITVFDRGKGIAEEDLARVFDPFFTRKSTGTGIGLSISRRFAESAGGRLTLANRPGGGAEARLTLPVHRGEKHS